ncbi:hypothetical protein GH714_000712 [Hevea brasiliensis]|uniref:Uncharacterized protein n=1 Tax=Hevea brasiliensis TaxID=3981 RepID=A0A6A6LRJ5_HEVBR|nr:hypothetical protein GH714_000712 [Hevea brasiliensis]
MFDDIRNITNLAPAMASKAALVSTYETLRIELGPPIGITIVNPGLIESEMTGGKFLNQQGQLAVQTSVIPLESTRECAKAIVEGACRGEKCLTEPACYRAIFFWKVLCPSLNELKTMASPDFTGITQAGLLPSNLLTSLQRMVPGLDHNLVKPLLESGSSPEKFHPLTISHTSRHVTEDQE